MKHDDKCITETNRRIQQNKKKHLTSKYIAQQIKMRVIMEN